MYLINSGFCVKSKYANAAPRPKYNIPPNTMVPQVLRRKKLAPLASMKSSQWFCKDSTFPTLDMLKAWPRLLSTH